MKLPWLIDVAPRLDFGDPFLEQLQKPYPSAPAAQPTQAEPETTSQAFAAPATSTETAAETPAPNAAPSIVVPPPTASGSLLTPMASPRSDR